MAEPIQDKLFRLSTCWKITRTDGDELYFTDHDVPLLLADNHVYIPAGGLSSSARQYQQGVKDNNFEVNGVIDSDFIDFEDLRAGKYREAEITEYIVDWSSPQNDPISTRRYWITQTTFNGQSWIGQITGQSTWLNRPVGLTYTVGCRHDLGDHFGEDGVPGCKIDLSLFTTVGTVVSVQKQRKSFVSDIHGVTGDYDDSNITWLTGANANFPKTQVKHYLADGSFSLQLFSAKDIAIGDTFSVYLACNHTTNICINRFNNIKNYGGFPFIPGTDRYVRTPMPK